jgi:hypothetical protein
VGHGKPEQLSSTMTHHEKGKQILECHAANRRGIPVEYGAALSGPRQ